MRTLFLILACAFLMHLDGQITVTEVVDVKTIELREDSTDVLEPVFTEPQKPGAIRDMHRFIGELLVYPEEAITEEIEGTVHVTFLVQADGSLSDIDVLRGIGSGCDEEAMRVVGLLPNWRPGTRNGVPVAMGTRLAIKFKLRDLKEDD